jgi:hypothetical protein
VTINTSNQTQPNPIYVPFRDATIANGDPVLPFRLWNVTFDNASTVVLGLINCSAPTQVFPLDEPAFRGRWR